MSERQADNALDFLSGGDEMSGRIRHRDWSQTSLGPCEAWPRSLKTALQIILNTRYPIWMGWGPELVFFYNGAYRPFIGKRDEWALGASARDVWKESWDEHLGPQADAVLLRGEASWNDQHQLIAYRNGYPEEVYFTYSYSPLPADEGGVGGLFCACTEETQRVLGERRLAALRHLAAATADARTEAQAALVAARTMAEHDADVSFALIYLISADGSSARLAGGSSDLRDARWAPPEVMLIGNGDEWLPESWPFRRAMDEGMQLLHGIAPERGLPGGRWPEPTTLTAVTRLAKAGDATPRGFLVVGASPRLPFDDNYRSFFELLARGTADALSNARAYEEERKRAEALAELDRAKTAFFSNVSHEFRTPLTLMLGPVQELLEKSRSDHSTATEDQLKVVRSNGLRLLRLVNSLLDFSRIEAGRVQARFEPTDLSAFTAELASSFRSATDRSGLTLIVDCPSLSAPVYIDRDMWEKVVLNLISNAFKFTFDGEIVVTTRQHESEAELVVRDTGVGIPAEALPRLFERFYRVDNVRSRTHEGSGIGLALVQELVKLHGGTVRADSTIGQGSSFSVRIPFGYFHLPESQIGGERTLPSTALGVSPFVEEALRWLPDQSDDRHDKGRHQEDFSSGNRSRILVVDDNADMRQYVARLLSERYEVEMAADGHAALTAVHAQRPDLVLSDVMLPNLDGFGLLRALRDDPRLKTLPVILLSARAGEESRVEGLERGADDYLTKPFSARELLARVQAHLDLSHLRQESEALNVRRMHEDRQEAEARLRQSEERWRAVFDNSAVGIALTDLSGRFLATNSAYQRMVGYSADELRALRFLDITHEDDRERNRGLIRELLEGLRDQFQIEKRYVRKDGGSIWGRNSVSLAPGSGNMPVAIMAIVEDITETKRTEEALRRTQAELANVTWAARLGEMTASIAHEVNQPLAAVVANGHACQRWLSTSPPNISKAAEAAGRIVKDGKDAGEVVRRVRALFKRTAVEKADLDLAVVIEEVLRLLDSYPVRRHVSLDLTLDPDLPTVFADRVQLQQLVMNLMLNALEALEPVTGRPKKLTVRSTRAESDQAVIEISDNGIGLDDPTSAFRPFVTTKPEGLGLGLAICRSIVAAHGGSLSAEPNAGFGTTFTITLPLRPEVSA
jgi:PAS domain S-box-containing protein